MLSGHYPPNSHLGLEGLPLYPGNPVLTLPFPEHMTPPAKILLEFCWASGWHGGGTDLVCCLDICNSEDKLERLS